MISILKKIGLFIGLGLIAYWFYSLGLDSIFKTIIKLKWGVIFVFFNSFLWLVGYTLAWNLYFSHFKQKIPFLSLLKIKICGEAVNGMTPVGFLGGDPVRVSLLKKHSVGLTRLGSVFMDRFLNTLATVVFVFISLIFLFTKTVDLSQTMRWFLFSFYLVLMMFLIWGLWDILEGRGLWRIEKILSKLKITKKYPKIYEILHSLEDEFSGLADEKHILLKAWLFHFFGRILGAVEISIIFYFILGNPFFGYGVILAGLTTVTHLVFFFIPGGLGAIETLYGFFFPILGFSPAVGVTVQLVRRLRALLWMGIGFVLLHQKKH